MRLTTKNEPALAVRERLADMAINLHASTGDKAADRMVSTVVASVEALCPGELSGHYVTGSRADGSGLADSDLDFYLVLAEAQSMEMIRRRVDSIGVLAVVRLDPMVVTLEVLNSLGWERVAVAVKDASLWAYGSEDIRPSIAWPAIEQYRARMRTQAFDAIQLFHGWPLTHPCELS